MTPNEARAREQRWRDAAWALPVAGVVLLVTPVVALFTGGAGLFGIPAAFIYVFSVWIGLIGCAFALARRRLAAHNDAGAARQSPAPDAAADGGPS
ncbi:MAG: hypothetical protein AAF631_06665 [Pseudomonadota bacterium]